jgi:hypothetical protein
MNLKQMINIIIPQIEKLQSLWLAHLEIYEEKWLVEKATNLRMNSVVHTKPPCLWIKIMSGSKFSIIFRRNNLIPPAPEVTLLPCLGEETLNDSLLPYKLPIIECTCI